MGVINVNVFGPPAPLGAAPLTVHLTPQVQVVDVDKDATFQCLVSGHPVNDIKWLQNGKSISRNSRIEVSEWDEGSSVRPLTLPFQLGSHGPAKVVH